MSSFIQTTISVALRRPLFSLAAVLAAVLIAVLVLKPSASKKESANKESSALKNDAKADAKSSASSGSTSSPKAALSVEAASPATLKMSTRLAANGNVVAWQEAAVSPELSGLRITEVNAQVGDWVQAGQVLVRLSGDTVRMDVAQAQAAVNEAQALVKEAQANAQRARDLQASGMMSAQQSGQLIAGEQSAIARLESAKAALQTQQVRLKHTELVAPDAGVVLARNASLGAVVNPGQELFRLARQGRLEWRAELTASELSKIKAGMNAVVRTHSGTNVNGTVRLVAPSVDAQSRNGFVFIALGKHSDLRVGSFLSGDVLMGEQQVLAIPNAAVFLRDGQAYAMQITEKTGADGKAVFSVRQQKLELGQRQTQTNTDKSTSEWVQVKSGLEANARIVAKGGAFLSDGDTVRLVNGLAR